jgi:hypothetical protein
MKSEIWDAIWGVLFIVVFLLLLPWAGNVAGLYVKWVSGFFP